MKRAKTVYYQTRIKELSLAKDMKKTWSLINTLLGKGGKSSNIAEINNNGIIYLFILFLFLFINFTNIILHYIMNIQYNT